ncbi:glycosyltransferase family 4 protein [Pontixanthobacter gangjinensis]|uniref:Glycosyltransferase n=1 Tax=Pontixanthobacter gangjinensis TaxID=1028742 RepID=A0A6I4SR71_9SPHN|nr:glycosyltransferase [Pontixanthobacter gangjinensis]MXO57377.1 glycosyltransferase [Pontixanthobacter gangjinensis]
MSHPKRVLSLSTLYPNTHMPRFGTFVARSLEALAARDAWEVTVINPIGVPPIAFGKYRPLAAAATDGMEQGVAVYRPRFTLIPNVGTRINPGVIARKVLPLAKRLHADNPFDLVDAQFFYPDGPAAAWIAHELGLPCSIKARGSDINFWGGKPYALEQMLDAAGRANGLLAVSDALAREMSALGMDYNKITLHYTGLDRDRFRPLDHVGLRGMLGQTLDIALPEGKPLLASVGGLIERKGQDLAIGALANIPGAQLLLVGHGPDEQHLRNLARDMRVEDRVHFLGSVDHDLLPVILSAADIMVLPSASEGLANAWVEALACGTPLVISNAGGARELVASPDAGMIVERTLEAVTAGIEHLLANPPTPEAVAANAERFSWDEHARLLDEYYSRLI